MENYILQTMRGALVAAADDSFAGVGSPEPTNIMHEGM